MRHRFPAGLALAGFVLAVHVVSAEQPQAPMPAPELKQIAVFEGSWTCDGATKESPFGPAGKMSSTADIKRDLDGHFQSGVIRSAMGPMQFEGRFYVTYDPGAKQFVMLWVDSMGGWARSTSAGWKGDTITYEGESHMGGQSMKTRDHFTRSGTSMLKHTSDMHAEGKWMTMMEETCRKK
ncbi:MAG: DUF1579 family protein [Acidobacteriota bacterium]